MKSKILLPMLIIISIMTGCEKSEPAPITYSKVTITKVTLLGISNTNNGVEWDNLLASFYPDVYFEITQAGTSNLIYDLPTNLRYENIQNSDLPKSWIGSPPYIVITNLTSSIDVDLWDYDSASADQYMGSTTFSFANYTSGTNKYPPSATVVDGSYIVKLDFTWSN